MPYTPRLTLFAPTQRRIGLQEPILHPTMKCACSNTKSMCNMAPHRIVLEECRLTPSTKTKGVACSTRSQHRAESPIVGPMHVSPRPSYVDLLSDARRTTCPSCEDYGCVGVPLCITKHQTSAIDMAPEFYFLVHVC